MEKATNSTNNAGINSNSNPSCSDVSFVISLQLFNYENKLDLYKYIYIKVNILTDFLCQIKSVNKTDASTLRQT